MLYLKRGLRGFVLSAVISLMSLLLIEVIVGMVGYKYVPMTPEFINMFPSETIALEVDVLLYGVYGFVFAAMTFIYDIDRIGFVIQTVIYAIATAFVWIPAVMFMWQLQKYPIALISTFQGFVVTYVIIIVVTYRNVKKNVDEVNILLSQSIERK